MSAKSTFCTAMIIKINPAAINVMSKCPNLITPQLKFKSNVSNSTLAKLYRLPKDNCVSNSIKLINKIKQADLKEIYINDNKKVRIFLDITYSPYHTNITGIHTTINNLRIH